MFGGSEHGHYILVTQLCEVASFQKKRVPLSGPDALIVMEQL
jgi:hypothetical protein